MKSSKIDNSPSVYTKAVRKCNVYNIIHRVLHNNNMQKREKGRGLTSRKI